MSSVVTPSLPKSAPKPKAKPAPAPAPAPARKSDERRRAARVPLTSHAALTPCPTDGRTGGGSARPAPIKVLMRDVSPSGVGIVHTAPLPIGQTYVVEEPSISKRKSVLFTVVRADAVGQNIYSIGLQDARNVLKRARISAMAKLLILAILMGGLCAIWTIA